MTKSAERQSAQRVASSHAADAPGPAGDVAPAGGARRRYQTPALQCLGDLRALTLGGSLGRSDSGAPTRQSRPGRI